MEQLTIPTLDAWACTRPGPYRICSTCETEKPLSPDYFNRDRHAPAGFGLRCKSCRNEADRRTRQLPAPPRSPVDEPDPIHAETERRLEAQILAARSGQVPEAKPLPKRTAVLVIVKTPSSSFCPVCNHRFTGSTCPDCRSVIHEADVDEHGAIHLELEVTLNGQPRGHYRARVDFDLLREGEEADAVSVEKAIGSAWVSVYRESTRKAITDMCERIYRREVK